MTKIKKTLLSVLIAAGMAFHSLPLLTSAEEAKLIALTFDDGPNISTTNDILDLLEQYDAKASFFLIGDNINSESAVSVKRAYDMGCEIDNHSKTHSNMSKMTPEEIQAEVAFVDEKVTEIIGEPTKFFRPPFIDTAQVMYDNIEQPFICGIDCQDYMPNVMAEERADYILKGAKDGVIVLLHDAAGNDQTVEALKIAMPELKKQGYEFVTLTELFERQGETPRKNILYSQVAKYPCADYTLHQTIDSADTATIPLDKTLLSELGDDYAIEVNYSGNANPPVIALQKWSSTPSVWKAIQPFYYNGERAVFLASDIQAALQETELNYADLDGITLSAFGGEITLSDAKIMLKSSDSSLIGDVNQDHVFNLTDVIMLQKWLLGVGSLTDQKAADFNHDQIINIYDLVLMKKALLKNIY